MPALAFADAAIAAGEDQGEAVLEVRLSGSYFRPISVAYTTGGGSATPGADYTPASGTLTFSPGQVARTIRIALRSDGRNEPNETIFVQLSELSNATLGGPDMAVVTITDSDPPPTVRFVGTERAVAEGAGSAVFTIELSQSSDLAVAVPYTVGGTATPGDAGLGTGDHSLRGGVAVIPARSTSARVRFSIIDDRIDEDDERVQINLGTPLNADLVSPSVYVVTIVDDDTAGVRLSRTTFELAEGQSGTYTVVLESEPTRQVTVQIGPDGQLGADRGALTFTPLNWSRPQTVTLTALDDDVDEVSPHIGLLDHVVVSNDPHYNRIDERASLRITATIADDDTAGVLVGAAVPPTVSEGPGPGNTATYTITLNSQPTAPVTLTVRPDSQLSASPPSLVFDAANWRTPQTVTVTAIDDAYDEFDPHPGVITHTVASDDLFYANLQGSAQPADVTVNIRDDDTAGIALTPGSLALSEAEPDQAGTYTVTLTSRPRQPVTITLSVTDTAQLAFAPRTLTFGADETSWSTPQTVTVTATDNFVDEGPDDPRVRLIRHTPASADPNFDALDPVTKTVTIADDDTAGVAIVSDRLSIIEGGTAIYTVTLTSEPTSDVTLELSSEPTGVITPSVTGLTFAPGNWSDPQTVTVQAEDNFLIDGDKAVTITHTVAPGSDPIYANLGARALDVTVTDNDTAGLAFSGDEEITEGAAPGTYGVALTSRPSAVVTVTLSLPPGIEADPATLAFSPDTWAVSQTVTVTATDDTIASGNRQATVIHSLSSADVNFNGAGPFTRTLTVQEDDVAGLALGLPTAQTLSESLAPTQTATFTVALTSEPTATVTLNLLTPDDQLGVSPAALTFDQISWSTPQTVTVRAINDAVAETPIHSGTIELSSTSADRLYNRAWPDSTLELEIEDDDVATVVVTAPASLGTNESGQAVTFQIFLTSEPATPVTIPVTLSPGAEASLSADAPWRLPLVFDKSNWQTAATVRVQGVDDSAYDGRQPFRVLIGPANSPGSGYDKVAPDLPALDLWNDDDEPALASVEDAAPVYEGGAEDVVTATFSVTLRRPATVTTTVSYETYDLTATEGEDYARATGAITITPGFTAGTITVTVYGDTAYERDEVFGLRLTGVSAPGDISGLDDAEALGTISDDDPAPTGTPLATPLFLVTGGPAASETYGYYYTAQTDASGATRGYGYVVVSIPCSWPAGQALAIELWSPAMHSTGNDIPAAGGAGTTTFELYDLGPAGLGGDLMPPAGAGAATTYGPSAAPERWLAFGSIPAPTPCGRYVLRAEASGDDENYWAVRAGYDGDGDPATPPEVAANGAERVTMATLRQTVEHRAAGVATTTWFYVAPGTETLLLRNFDLDRGAGGTPPDPGARIRYYSPGQRYDPTGATGGSEGTPSAVGWSADVFSQPRPGWWRAVVYTGSAENAYVLEALADGATLPMQYELPPLPAIRLTATPSRATAAPQEALSLTLTYESLGQTTATKPTLTLALPGALTFEGNPCEGAPAGCSWSPESLSLELADLAPGAAGAFSLRVVVAPEAGGATAIGLEAAFGDGMGNPFNASAAAALEVLEGAPD